MLRKRKAGPRKATTPLSQKAAQLQEEEGSLLDDSAKAAVARVHSERKAAKAAAAAAEAAAQAPAGVAGTEAAQVLGTSPQTEVPAAGGPSTSAPDAGEAAAGASVASGSFEAFEAGGASDRKSARPREAADGGQAGEGPGQTFAADAENVPAEEDSGSGEGASSDRKPKKHGALQGKRKVAIVVICSVAALLVVFIAALSWNRWFRYDDVADFQGEWIVQGGTDSITIDSGLIHLTDKDAYGYSLDATAKTIRFTFSDLSGDARYRFSADRSEIALQDGVFGSVDTFFDDLAWMLGGIGSSLMGNEQASPSFGDGSTVLVRVDSLTDEQRQQLEARRLEQMTPEERAAAEDESQRLAEEQAAAEAAQAAAEEEQRQQELNIQDALAGDDDAGEVGVNAVRPEDLM